MNPEATGNYPDAIHEIIETNCSISGCHNAQSKAAAAGLDLTSWATAIEGSRSGQVVVPFNSGQSTLFLFTNTYEDLGVSVLPTMPLNSNPLSKSEIELLQDWINNGAPSKQQEIPFSGQSSRPKYYVLNALCDEISVIDAQSGLVMRSYSPPLASDPGFAEMIRVSEDGNYVYVLFSSGVFAQYDARTDEFVNVIQLEEGLWRSFVIGQDNKAYIFDWSGNSSNDGAKIKFVELPQMTFSAEQINSTLYFPMGGELDPSGNFLYSSCFTGNFMYKINLNSHNVDTVLLENNSSVEFNGSPFRPGFIKFFPDGKQYAVVCEKSNEVRIYDAVTDENVLNIPTGKHPQEITFSENHHLMAITCMEDQSVFSEGKGYVLVVSTEDFNIQKRIYSGYQPKGIIADDEMNRFVVANRNADPTGADAPHHFTACDGNNGYISFIDMNSLETTQDYRMEVSVDPYSVDIRK